MFAWHLKGLGKKTAFVMFIMQASTLRGHGHFGLGCIQISRLTKGALRRGGGAPRQWPRWPWLRSRPDILIIDNGFQHLVSPFHQIVMVGFIKSFESLSLCTFLSSHVIQLRKSLVEVILSDLFYHLYTCDLELLFFLSAILKFHFENCILSFFCSVTEFVTNCWILLIDFIYIFV